MNHYIELTLIDSPDFSLYQLWSDVYMQLHLALVEMKDKDNKTPIGISFPQYRFNQEKGIGFVGTKFRFFSENEADLQKLDIRKWLDRLTDYVHISSIREVPKEKITGYSTYSRKQVKTNAERLARHDEKKGRYSYENAVEHYRQFITTTDLPYIQMKSLTSDQSFKLFIKKQAADKSESQVFSTYGLNSVSTVPEF